MRANKLYIAVFLVALVCLVSGWVDLDWMIIAPRFNPWYFTVDYWMFCPGYTMPWHSAYLWSMARLVFGVAIIGFWLGRWEKKNL
ncbi:MAG: hypothetical protein IBV52_08680 [Candidatus Bathyarchaeota archaeon]